jgi:hypothetical protein
MPRAKNRSSFLKISANGEMHSNNAPLSSEGGSSRPMTALDNFQRVKLFLLLSNKAFTLPKIGG